MQETNIAKKRDGGFTLVELLIVIVILGILATVTVFAVHGITNKGEVSACQADQKTLETAIEAWYALPTVDAAGVAKDIAAGTAGVPDETELVAVKLLRGPSSKFDIIQTAGATQGNLVATGTPACVVTA